MVCTGNCSQPEVVAHPSWLTVFWFAPGPGFFRLRLIFPHDLPDVKYCSSSQKGHKQLKLISSGHTYGSEITAVGIGILLVPDWFRRDDGCAVQEIDTD